MVKPNFNNPDCVACYSTSVRKNGTWKATKRRPDRAKIQRYRCNSCGHSFTLEDMPRTVGDSVVTAAESCRRWRANRLNTQDPLP
jgi:transposase-like protein